MEIYTLLAGTDYGTNKVLGNYDSEKAAREAAEYFTYHEFDTVRFDFFILCKTELNGSPNSDKEIDYWRMIHITP